MFSLERMHMDRRSKNGVLPSLFIPTYFLTFPSGKPVSPIDSNQAKKKTCLVFIDDELQIVWGIVIIAR